MTDSSTEQVPQLTSIKRSMHKDIIASFWTMLQECESRALDENDALLKLWVEGWYRQWNRMTGSNKEPRWKSTAKS